VTRLVPALVLAATVAVALTVAAPAGAARECDGLQVCVPVRGPWVVVPAGEGAAARARVEWELRCPRNYIVGGLDAQLSARTIDVAFYGLVGSPVNPGITTRRAVTVYGSQVGAASRSASFRPFIGCIPATGGGPRLPTSATAFPPGEPTSRRVTTARVRPGTATVTARCARGERLVGSSYAFGFDTRTAPSASLAASVSGTRVVGDGRVAVRVRGDAELEGVRGLVQVHALCAGAR
jgi:hypothetical protein